MQKKVGIITMYYKSTNYGGNLQAYALSYILKQNGYDAEQICFLTSSLKKESSFIKLKKLFLWGIKPAFSKIISKVKHYKKSSEKTQNKKDEKLIQEQVKLRNKAFENFNQEIIPHSSNVYYADTITNSLANYDAFITGSDQVWNLKWYHPIYFLDFVPNNKIKLSYAASISAKFLSKKEKRVITKSLKSFDAISVREKSDEENLESSKLKNIETVLDPTLLLTQNDWNKVCKDIEEESEYVFCYFLGKNEEAKNIAINFAKDKKLKLIAFVYPGEKNYADENIFCAPPEEFLGYIKKAAYVFTDSFHATVFSYLYKKQFYVFNRNKSGNMNSRILNITDIFNLKERFCDEQRENLEYINSLKPIDYSNENKKLTSLIEKSKLFLFEALQGKHG